MKLIIVIDTTFVTLFGLRKIGKKKSHVTICDQHNKTKVGLNNNRNKEESTIGELRRIVGVGDEASDEASFSHSGITDQYDLEGVIVVIHRLLKSESLSSC